MKTSCLLLLSGIVAVQAHGSKKGWIAQPRFVARPVLPVLPARPPVAPVQPFRPAPPMFPQELSCTPPSTTCPTDFALSGHLCEKEILTAADSICTSGTLEGQLCIHKIPTQPSCQEGFTLRGDVCVHPESIPATPFCPEGFSDTGSGCSKTLPAPVIDICTRGSRVGDNCVVTSSAPPRVTSYCPAGYEDESGECCRIETYDCTPPGATPLDCDDDDTSEICVSRRHLRNLHCSGGAAGCEYSAPPRPAPRPAARPAIQEIAVIHQTCQKKVTTPMLHDTSCDVGELVGRVCIIKEYFSLEQRCTVGGDPANCFTTQSCGYEHSCPESHIMAGTSCITTREAPTIPTCPPSFDLSVDCCVRSTPASPICRVGSLGADGFCHDKEFAPPTTTWCTTCTGTNCIQTGCPA